jgi:hypothetical protein
MMSLIPKRNHKDNDHQEKGSICGIEQGLIMHELGNTSEICNLQRKCGML